MRIPTIPRITEKVGPSTRYHEGRALKANGPRARQAREKENGILLMNEGGHNLKSGQKNQTWVCLKLRNTVRQTNQVTPILVEGNIVKLRPYGVASPFRRKAVDIKSHQKGTEAREKINRRGGVK